MDLREHSFAFRAMSRNCAFGHKCNNSFHYIEGSRCDHHLYGISSHGQIDISQVTCKSRK